MSDIKYEIYNHETINKINEIIRQLEKDIDNLTPPIDEDYSKDYYIKKDSYSDIIEVLEYQRFKNQRDYVNSQIGYMVENGEKESVSSMTYEELWYHLVSWEYPREEFFEKHQKESNRFYKENGLFDLISENKYWIS